MKYLMSFILVITSITCYSQNPVKENVLIAEDKNLSVTLSYLKISSIADFDWISLNLINNSYDTISLRSLTCNVNNIRSERMNDYDLLVSSSNNQQPLKIEPKQSIKLWRKITNHVSSLVESQNPEDSLINLLFKCNLNYEIQNESLELNSNNIQLTFEWNTIENIDRKLLVSRLVDILRNPDNPWETNNFITSKLMNIEEVTSQITTSDLIQGILIRGKDNVLLLSELKRRKKFPNKDITKYLRSVYQTDREVFECLIQYYWDDKLLPLVLKISDQYLKYKVLELNSNYWSQNKETSELIYNNLVKERSFEFPKMVDEKSLKRWSEDVKVIAIARCPLFNDYLYKFLDSKKEYEIYDTSTADMFCGTGCQSPIIKVRVSDIAFVAILRNMDQINFEYAIRFNHKTPVVNFKDDILERSVINSFDYSILEKYIKLNFYERDLRLTPELILKLKKNRR